MNPIVLPPLDIAIDQLNTLRQAEQRARFRVLLPLIDELVNQGVSHAAIVTALAKTGISLKTPAVRQALYRWRKRQAQAGAQAAVSTSPVIAAATSPSKPVGFAGGSITSKADLVRLRKSNESIDLNHLAEFSRQK